MKAKKTFTLTRLHKGREATQTFSFFVELWPLRKKWRQAFKILFLYWAGVPLFLFIPVLHFILVPLFLFLGIGGFVFVLRKEDRILTQDISCPLCHKALPISSTNFSDFTSLVCSYCYERWNVVSEDGK